MNLGKQQPGSQPKLEDEQSTRSRLGVRRILLATCLVCVGLVLGIALGQWVGRSTSPSAVSKASDSAEGETRWVSGPWGDLQIRRIQIERPDEFVASSFPPGPPTRWFFAGLSEQQLQTLFSQKDLTAEQQAVLLDTHNWEVQTNGIYVTPGRETILNLSPAARQRLYDILATNAVNFRQRWAFKMRSDEVEQRFARSGLSPETLSLVRRFLYRQGKVVCFSDLDEVLSRIPSVAEKRRLIKVLSRQPAALATLKITEGQDVEPLIRYWGREGRAKDVGPLLEALARLPGGATVDIAELLPPFARMLLNTFPYPSEDPLVSRRDCTWSSMNFFKDEPDKRFYDFAVTRQVVNREYYPIQDDPKFGDIVWFSDAEGNTVHVAVYIAADILFTKNGANFNEPWLLMEMKDLLARYTTGTPLKVTTYRRKES